MRGPLGVRRKLRRLDPQSTQRALLLVGEHNSRICYISDYKPEILALIDSPIYQIFKLAEWRCLGDFDMDEQEIDSQISAASAKLSLAEVYLKKGIDNGDRAALQESITYSRQGLSQTKDNQSLLSATLLAICGSALCKMYEIDGHLSTLTEGLASLRQSHVTLQQHQSTKAYRTTSENLVVSLVRAGEQTGDIALLREALVLVETLLMEQRFKPGHEDMYVLVNAKAVAQLRIGSYCADTALVEAAILTLKTFLKEAGLSDVAKQQTMQNLCAAFIENARQTRSERVYRELLSWLWSKFHRIHDNTSAYFAQYYGQASIELLRLTSDISVAERAINIHKRLIKWYETKNPFRQLEALHSLAQAHFQAGKHLKSERHFKSAIRAMNKALELVQSETLPVDSRAHRLIADLGAYKFALALTIKKPELIAEAVEHYVSATNLVSAVKAPSLFVEVAKGLFYLYYQQKRWDSALQMFGDIESAWSKIIADPHLSGAVHLQGARQLAGEYTRAAWALLQTGAVVEAALMLDRGRARQLNAILNVGIQSGSQLSPPKQKRLAAAARTVETARLSASDEVCSSAWAEYLRLRRQLGLDTVEQQLSIESIQSRIPENGAIVQLLIAPEGAAAFILSRRNDPLVRHVPLRHDTLTQLSKLFHQGSEVDQTTWMPTYQRYVGKSKGPAYEPVRSSSRYRDWSALVSRACEVLGELIFNAVNDDLVASGISSGAEVIICPPGELACLPLPMALLKDGLEFSRHWSVSVAPRLSVLPTDTYSQQQHTLLAISPPATHNFWRRSLPFAEHEVRLVRNRFPRRATTYLSPKQAKLDNVLRGLKKTSVIHAACHGVYDWTEPENSGLKLADNRRLTVKMLSSSVGYMRKARLAFLSACESAITGATAVPDEFAGLPTSFLQAGVRAVIGALWPVFDDAAMLICDRFYHYYLDAQGQEIMPPARALSLAQNWLRHVTVHELRELGYFASRDLEQLCGLRSATPGTFRLRGLAVRSPETAQQSFSKSQARSRTKNRVGKNHYLQPYESPAEWAAFVTYGR
jgi:CHAT domain-containing protein/tetratricopeptide (TPR) repeat protein